MNEPYSSGLFTLKHFSVCLLCCCDNDLLISSDIACSVKSNLAFCMQIPAMVKQLHYEYTPGMILLIKC